MILIIKYVTGTYRYGILDIDDICQKEGYDNLFYVKFKPEIGQKNEKFRSNDWPSIVKVFKELQTKEYQIRDERKDKKEKDKKRKREGDDLSKKLFTVFD
jgi:hypothetical protein